MLMRFMFMFGKNLFAERSVSVFGKNSVSVHLISSNDRVQYLRLSMKPDTQMFFQDPANLLKQHQMQLTKLLEFQKEHRTRLVTFHRKMLFKYKELEGNCKLASEKIQQLERENANLKKILNSGNLGGGGGAIESGGIGGYAHSQLYATPHESYQRAICASGKKNSPQTTSSFISPGVSRISPGRLTLVKANSPSSKVFNEGSSFSPQESLNKGTTQYLSPRTSLSSYQAHEAKLNADVASGVPLYCSLPLDGKRTPSPAMSRLSSSNVSSPSVMYHSFQPSQSNHYSQGYLASKSYSHLPPGSQLIKSTPNQMQRGNFSNGPQPMIYSPDPSLLQRSLGARSYSKY